MSHQWISREELGRIHEHHAKERQQLRKHILALCAAIVRMDRNGYQQQLLDRVYMNTGVSPEDVAAYNDRRNDRIAARKRAQGQSA